MVWKWAFIFDAGRQGVTTSYTVPLDVIHSVCYEYTESRDTSEITRATILSVFTYSACDEKVSKVS